MLILGFISALMVTEFMFGGSHLAATGQRFVAYEPVTSLFGMVMGVLPAGLSHALGVLGFWVHLVIVLAFLILGVALSIARVARPDA